MVITVSPCVDLMRATARLLQPMASYIERF